jgi:hypothetical protein
MSPIFHPPVGTIRMEPVSCRSSESVRCDDSSLERLLASFIHREVLSDAHRDGLERPPIVGSRRIICPPAATASVMVRANLSQLLDDLKLEYEQIAE